MTYFTRTILSTILMLCVLAIPISLAIGVLVHNYNLQTKEISLEKYQNLLKNYKEYGQDDSKCKQLFSEAMEDNKIGRREYHRIYDRIEDIRKEQEVKIEIKTLLND